jgi:DNA-binding NarL/FixJ family response regulator
MSSSPSANGRDSNGPHTGAAGDDDELAGLFCEGPSTATLNLVERRHRVFVIGQSVDDAARLRDRLSAAGVYDIVGHARSSDVRAGVVRVPPDIDFVVASPRDFAADSVAAMPEEDPLVEALTPRERTVLTLAADGLPNRDIAAALELSEHTVKFHLASIFGKLGVRSRTEAVRRGLRLGLIEL